MSELSDREQYRIEVYIEETWSQVGRPFTHRWNAIRRANTLFHRHRFHSDVRVMTTNGDRIWHRGQMTALSYVKESG